MAVRDPMRLFALLVLLVGCTGTDKGSDEDDTDSATSAPDVPVLPGPTDTYTEGYYTYEDWDLDGYMAWEDCDDTNPDVNPGMQEIDCDGLDNDCDGEIDVPRIDLDGDGVTAAAGDCDDFNADIRPGGVETADGLDEDCDGVIDEHTEVYDDDGDGYCEVGPCADGSLPSDCNDGDPLVNPGMVEDLTDFFDNDCNGIVDAGTLDVDGDGYNSDGGDCDDTDPATFPGAPELADSIDNDCDGITDEGTLIHDDGDGYCEDPGSCSDGSAPGDCDDSAADSYPGGLEFADWRDNNCNGVVDEGTESRDDDGDGYTEAGGDCDDTNPADSPSTGNVCGGLGPAACAPPELPNGVDDDCDGTVDKGTDWYDDDGDGFAEAGGDCDDGDALIRPGVLEVGDSSTSTPLWSGSETRSGESSPFRRKTQTSVRPA